MGLAVLFDLKTVFDISQELVGGRQAGVLAAGKQALVAQTEKREHGAAVAHPRVAAAVEPLEALHQKLDVANAAGREFDIEPVLQAAPRRQLLADSLARFGDRLDRAEIQGALVDERLDELEQAGARLGLAGRDPRLDQHLLFPIARALFVIRLGPVFGDRNLAQRAVGPQA